MRQNRLSWIANFIWGIADDVLSDAHDAWVAPARCFYTPQPLRTLDEIRADILALEREPEVLLDGILGGHG